MTKPTIVITGKPPWFDDFSTQLADTYTVTHEDDQRGYITRLIESQAALIIVAADTTVGWRFWTTTPKSSPATRRIPIIVVTDAPKTRHQALIAGADIALSTTDFRQGWTKLVQDYARVLSPADREALDCGCQEPLPPLAQQGIVKFNVGEYYKQHDLFEEQWVNTSGPVRALYQAILQVGVAYYQIERGNYRGAYKMLQRSTQWLRLLPDVCQGVDVQRLRADSSRVQAELARLGEANFNQFDTHLLQPVKLVE